MGIPDQHKPSGKIHGSPEDAFRCKKQSLIKQGYVQVGAREFKKGDDPILVIDRRSKFGTPLYWTKEKTRYIRKDRIFP